MDMKALRGSHRATNWTVAVVLGLVIGSALSVRTAVAGIRIYGRVDTPHVSVRVGHPRPSSDRVVVRAPRPRIVHRPVIIERHAPHRLSPHDRGIAWRMSYLSGIAEHRLVRLRLSGYGWRTIGDIYDLPRSMVRASFSERAFDRYLHRRGSNGGWRSCGR
jgi:hypothetical protein